MTRLVPATSTRPFNLGVVTSHPVQYQAPLFRALARASDVRLTVLYCSDWGARRYRDSGFQQEFEWDVPLLDGYEWVVLKNRSPRPSLSSFWGLVNPSLVAELRRRRFDAVWIPGWATFSYCLALLSAAAFRIPVLLRGESTLLTEPRPMKALARKVLFSTMFARVSGCLAIGERNRAFYRAFGVPAERIFIVPYAVDNDFFFAQAEASLPRRAATRAELGFHDALPVALFCGKLIPQKRPLELLEAVRALRDRGITIGAVFVGDGSLRGELEAFVARHGLDGVRFVGFRNQTELCRYYASADVFVLPSGFEPWGLVVNEAMCFGLPIVVSDRVGAAADLVRQGENGFVYASGETAALTRALETLATDSEGRRRMGDASRRRIAAWGFGEDVAGVRACLEALRASRAGMV